MPTEAGRFPPVNPSRTDAQRDYLQHLILWLLYDRNQELVFKGGTALRLVYGDNRYSEDLDFNGPRDLAAVQGLWEKVTGGLQDFGSRRDAHLLAEKVRGKPRDLYVIWLLLRQGVEPDASLIERKLALYEMARERDVLEAALQQVRTDWERDLRPLLPQFVPYENVRQDVAILLR